MSNQQTLVLVDGSSLAFRSFYAMFKSGLRAKDGTPTGAVHGFFASLFDLIEKQKPDMLAVCFDLSDPTFRHEEFKEYKANRDEMPDELAVQWPIIKEGVTTLDIPLYELSGFEADDVIGTVAKIAEQKGIKVIILTGDQDAFQLLAGEQDNIEVLMPSREGLITYKRDKVFEKLKVYPEQIIDYKGLCGDKSDNIPGVRGIGEVTAAKLLAEHGTIDGIYANIDSIKSASIKQKLIDGKESAYASQRLATIRLDVPLEFDFEHCKLSVPELSKVASFFERMNFKSLTARLPKVMSKLTGTEVVMPQAAPQSASEPVVASTMTMTSTSNGGTTSATSQMVAKGGQLTLALDFNSSAAAPTTPTDLPANYNRELAALAEGGRGRMVSVKPRLDIELAPLAEPWVITSEQDLDQLIAELNQQTIISVDLETTGLASLNCEIVGWAISYDPSITMDNNQQVDASAGTYGAATLKAAYIPVRHQITGDKTQLAPELVASKLKPILENPAIGKIAQNAKYEMNVMSLLGIKFGPVVFDPMLASYIENPDNKHGLKDQSERILNYKMVKIAELIGTGRKQLTIDMVPLDSVAAYAADDARITLELARYYAKTLDDEQKYLLYKMELPLCAVIAKMEQAGVALDMPFLAAFSNELASELARLESEIYALAGHGFNINSTQQLQKVLFEELGIKPKGKTKSKSGFSTDASVLEALKEEHAIISKLLEYRHITKLKSTYVDALPREVLARDNRLHGEFNQTVAATGRLSSSNPNLQNIPIRTELGRRIRRSFIAQDPNSSLISADYSQIELRLLAHMSKDELLIDAFEKNQDIHARTAGEIFEIPIEEVSSETRRVGKTINFALVYQQGAFSTGQDLGVSTKEAQAFIDKYFSRYPKVKGFLQSTIDEAREHNYAKTIWGRKRYFNYLHDRNDNVRRADERAACNAPIQGSAADLVKLAMIKLDEELSKSGLKAKLILQVHDELVLEVPDNELEETKALVARAMLLDQPLLVPLQVDFGIGKNWMDAK